MVRVVGTGTGSAAAWLGFIKNQIKESAQAWPNAVKNAADLILGAIDAKKANPGKPVVDPRESNPGLGEDNVTISTVLPE